MSRINERPVILALSNPTEKAECTPEQAYTWSKGKAIYAAGVQFAPVHYNGQTFLPGQANNFYIFPAVGMAIFATQAKRVTDEMFIEAGQRGSGSGAVRFAQAGPIVSVAVEYSGNRDPDGGPRGEARLRQRARPSRSSGGHGGVHPRPMSTSRSTRRWPDPPRPSLGRSDENSTQTLVMFWRQRMNQANTNRAMTIVRFTKRRLP